MIADGPRRDQEAGMEATFETDHDTGDHTIDQLSQDHHCTSHSQDRQGTKDIRKVSGDLRVYTRRDCSIVYSANSEFGLTGLLEQSSALTHPPFLHSEYMHSILDYTV